MTSPLSPFSFRLNETTYRNWRALELETDQVKLVVLPELGAKIASLRYLDTGKEWLVSSGDRKLHKVEYGSTFTEADVSGWDECFPTIIGGAYPITGSFEGRPIPDHGELWSVAWQAEIRPGMLMCTIQGKQLPYRFSRCMYFTDERTLRLEYEAVNTGDEAISVFWAAHPLFQCTPHTQICLPKETESLLCVDGGRFLRAGKVYDWPGGDGSLPRPLNQPGPVTGRDARKFYHEGAVASGWAGLHEDQTGEFLILNWDPEQLPYLGMWLDEGVYCPEPVCALEPANGYYDSLDEASRQGRLVWLQPGGAVRWRLDVRLGCGTLEDMYSI